MPILQSPNETKTAECSRPVSFCLSCRTCAVATHPIWLTATSCRTPRESWCRPYWTDWVWRRRAATVAALLFWMQLTCSSAPWKVSFWRLETFFFCRWRSTTNSFLCGSFIFCVWFGCCFFAELPDEALSLLSESSPDFLEAFDTLVSSLVLFRFQLPL